MSERKEVEAVVETVKSEEKETQTIQSGVVLTMNDKNNPEIRIVGNVSLAELTAFNRLLGLVEQSYWDESLKGKNGK